MTFNIRYDTASDGPHAWPRRATAVAAIIQAEGVEVVGLQEVLWSQYTSLLALLGASWVGVFRGRSTGGEGDDAGEAPAIIFQKDVLYSTEKPYVFWFSPTPEAPGSVAMRWGASLPRACLQLHFLHLPSGRSFWMLNAHLDHASADARHRSAALLLSKLPDRGTRDPIVVTGDFNASPAEATIERMRHNLVDAVASASELEARRGTFHDFKGGDPGVSDHIDYIFATSGVEVAGVHVNRSTVDGVLPSDHYPVSATLRWR